MRTFLFLALSAALILQAGCGGDDGRPSDLPKLYPVSITITQADNPLEGATVTLTSKTPTTYGTASGTTNASGIAVIRTYGYNGVPAGDYAVSIEKQLSENQREGRTLEGEPYLFGGELYNYVEAKFSQASGTPLSTTVTAKGVKETFDVGAPVRTFIRNNPGASGSD
jgi:hypothetical protein